MGIVKEFKCFVHGAFTSEQPVCPHGCTMAIEREFRTAPGIRHMRTKSIDRTLGALAAQFGYSDLNNKNGAVAGGNGNPLKQRDLRPVWGQVPKGDVLNVGKGAIEGVDGAQGGAVAAANASRVAPARDEQSFTDIAKALPKPRAIVDKKLIYGTATDLHNAVKNVA